MKIKVLLEIEVDDTNEQPEQSFFAEVENILENEFGYEVTAKRVKDED